MNGYFWKLNLWRHLYMIARIGQVQFYDKNLYKLSEFYYFITLDEYITKWMHFPINKHGCTKVPEISTWQKL